MSVHASYVCAFPGRRDSYEVPAALAEAGRLARFLTDFYWSGVTAAVGEKLLPSARLQKARMRRMWLQIGSPGGVERELYNGASLKCLRVQADFLGKMLMSS
jgi:hypothetical protein